jgi:hypothetical protein
MAFRWNLFHYGDRQVLNPTTTTRGNFNVKMRTAAGGNLGVLVLASFVALAGCRSEKTETMRVPKEGTGSPSSSAPASAPGGGTDMGQMGSAPAGGGQMSGGQPMSMPNDSIHGGLAGGTGQMGGGMGGGAMGGSAGTASLQWNAPSGWTEKPPSSMRVGSYDVPGQAGPADMSIVVLSGQAGGDLANVNRWRGQLGLSPIDEAELARTARHVKSPAGDVMVVDIGGAEAGGKRMLAGMMSRSGETWFFKLNGPDATVSGARGNFMKLLESVHAPSGG